MGNRFAHRGVDGFPSDWKFKRLRDVSELLTDGTHFSPASKDGPCLYITSKNIGFGRMDLSDVSYISQEEHDEIYRGCPVTFGDLLLTKDGANTGNAALNRIEEPFSLLSSVALIRANERFTTNQYLLQFILSPRGQYYIKNEMAGQAITRLTLKKIGGLVLPFPPLPEQRKIAAILSTWDEAIALTERLIAALQARKRGLMQRLLTGQVRFPGFDDEWREVRLGEVFKERKQRGYEHLPLLSVTDDGITYRDSLDRRDTSNADKSKYLHICPGDIGYNTMRMWQGRSALSSLEGIVSPAYTILIPQDTIDVRFMAYLFKYPPMIYVFWRYSQGLVSDTLSLKYPNFARIRVTIPSVDEQQRIADFLVFCDQGIELNQSRLAHLKQQKKGLMQRLLTGQVRVRVD
jgi:type I restriction enzyme S subunit